MGWLGIEELGEVEGRAMEGMYVKDWESRL